MLKSSMGHNCYAREWRSLVMSEVLFVWIKIYLSIYLLNYTPKTGIVETRLHLDKRPFVRRNPLWVFGSLHCNGWYNFKEQRGLWMDYIPNVIDDKLCKEATSHPSSEHIVVVWAMFSQPHFSCRWCGQFHGVDNLSTICGCDHTYIIHVLQNMSP